MTLAHFHSSGKIPEVIEQLKIEQREAVIKSRHSFKNLAGILSKPVALVLHSLDSILKTLE